VAGPVGFWSDKLPQIKTRPKKKVQTKCSRQVVSEAKLQLKLHCNCNQQPAKDIFKSNSIWVLAFGDLLSLGIARLAIHIIFQLRKPLGNDQENIQDFLAYKKCIRKSEEIFPIIHLALINAAGYLTLMHFYYIIIIIDVTFESCI